MGQRILFIGIVEDKKRRFLTRFRKVISPLRIETGRYEGHIMPLDKRICPCCESCQIENELHMFSECPLYNNIRQVLRNVLVKEQCKYALLNGEIFLIECMRARGKNVVIAVAEYVFEAFK
jgi:hypothetical protein